MDEIVNEKHPNLELEIDPKLSFALRNPSLFPVDINKADYAMILRVPGIGPKSAQQIVTSRKYQRLTSENLKKMGVVMKRAKYFITCGELGPHTIQEIKPEGLRRLVHRTGEEAEQGRPAGAADVVLTHYIFSRGYLFL